MSGTPNAPDPIRQMLMHFGGHLTMVMASKGFTPEVVASGSSGNLTEDEVLKIMTGSDPNVPVAKLAYIAGLLDVPFSVGLTSAGYSTKPLPAPSPAPAPVA